jgi:hypothetical protein
LITERTEKWATPTFLLVIHSAAPLTDLRSESNLQNHPKFRY